MQDGRNPSVRMVDTSFGHVAIYSFGSRLPSKPCILVLKLDHLGDFLIGLPSLRRLREAFPTASIRLVVGAWNQGMAKACGLVDEVAVYNYFSPSGWTGEPYEPVENFHRLTAGRYDIAIDLRVDDDTRSLLAGIDAAVRCGIGAQSDHPFLDVRLPPPLRHTDGGPSARMPAIFIEPNRFQSAMPFKYAFYHETDFRPVEGHVVYGPDITLPLGEVQVSFDLHLTGWRRCSKNVSISLDVARNGAEIVVHKRLRMADIKSVGGGGVTVSFFNHDDAARYEFRIHITGQPFRTGLRFGGVRLQHVAITPPARFRPADLHIGEQLSLLVQLVADRTRGLYPGALGVAADMSRPGVAATTRRIAVAPFSNKELRDWPAAHYAVLIRMLIERLDCSVMLLGSAEQVGQLDRLVADIRGGKRVRHLGGQTAWSDLPDMLRQMDLVICNNSGIAHLAAAVGVMTLAIYSGSHQPQEWGPRGESSRAMMAVVPCSPCGYDRLVECREGYRCMHGLAPETVFDEARTLLADGAIASVGAIG
jgi:ADP-heptose:LPS heptosyltransferase